MTICEFADHSIKIVTLSERMFGSSSIQVFWGSLAQNTLTNSIKEPLMFGENKVYAQCKLDSEAEERVSAAV